MEALTLFQQNFAIAESLLQVHRLFEGMDKADLSDQLRLAICKQWQAPEHSVVQHACNDRVSVLARATTRISESLTIEGGLDFLLRQAVIVACTSLEPFFGDALIVHASARIFLDAISALQAEIRTAEEQELARRHAQSA